MALENLGSEKKLFLTPEVKAQYIERGEALPHIQSVFGWQIRFYLSKGFPLLTTKKGFIVGLQQMFFLYNKYIMYSKIT